MTTDNRLTIGIKDKLEEINEVLKSLNHIEQELTEFVEEEKNNEIEVGSEDFKALAPTVLDKYKRKLELNTTLLSFLNNELNIVMNEIKYSNVNNQ